MKSTLLLKLNILLLFICSSICAQKFEPKEKLLEADHVIESKITNRTYELYISCPDSYSIKDTLNYPVLYVLDGLYYFPTINQARETIGWGGKLKDLIIVGLSSGINNTDWFINRTLDYTTSVSTSDAKRYEKGNGLGEGTIKSGGAAKFLKVLKAEIIPFVDKHYKTNADRGIAGHSFGGLFASYCLMNLPTLFSKYSINSPSFWWDNEKLLLETKSKLAEYENFEIDIFISVGGAESASIMPQTVQFYYDLKEFKNKGINLEWKIFEDETHFSVVPAALSRTLSVLYRK
ncbi:MULTISPECIES: alpha/beta hydrolase [unclassified Polaribacter]|uniref:alpha/beta hydrolase n=1 Tax=unclassified Polaribacter TaxID=196858 RepID=UPI0011BDC53D|nr:MULTISPECIES: alpha/beta hydrolase-fold protein [unclassified Polaribacter]TXD50365.1 alpha/beta hydrolase [Polaribacter sp. IC063]TXD56457.1 alpha/beta hydrolase [Polaribacter sp. IC066]